LQSSFNPPSYPFPALPHLLARLPAPLPDASLGHAAQLVWSGRAFLPTKAPAAATLEGMK